MAREALVSDFIDPLSGLNGPLLFPRTVRASAEVPLPADSRDLDSIHNFMKSLELRSPEKLMSEAKRIVDGGAELLESNLASFAENMGITDAIAAKGKDGPQDRRPGLGLARKRAAFSLKTSVSQPSVSLEPTLNIDHLQDPDEFFDAFERMENAKKEIQKQMGGSTDNLNLYKPSNNTRRRRPGILGKSYIYKHRYSSAPSENDDILMSSQETEDQVIPSASKDKSQEKLVYLDPNPDADLEEVELPVSMKKTENEVNDILKELLSCNNEDLEGDGALNLLQERLNIKPLDLENLWMSEQRDVGRTSILNVAESLQKHRKSSLVIDSVLINLNRKSHMEHEPMANSVNPVCSPTPPRSPLASISLLKKRILQPNPMRDPFSPLNVDLSACRNASPLQPKDKLLDQVDARKDLGMSSESESHVEIDNTEPSVSNMHVQGVIGNTDDLSEQVADQNASIQSTEADCRPIEESENNIEKTMNFENESNPFVLEDEVMDNAPSRQQTHLEQKPEEVIRNAGTLPEQVEEENAGITSSGPNEESEDKIENTMNVNENESNPYVLENEARDDASSRQQTDLEQHPEVHQAKLQKGKRVAGEKRIRQAHPMRKSLAESGTSFDTGVRRSKRIKMRPLEYWKGERFLYGRVDDSFKLIGVKYISPGKGNDNLKVKPYLLSESSEFKELLELAARH